MSSRVELLPHNPAWAAAFEAEAARLITALQPILILVHHIGSTRIPRILAKPTIDILVEVTFLPRPKGGAKMSTQKGLMGISRSLQ